MSSIPLFPPRNKGAQGAQGTSGSSGGNGGVPFYLNIDNSANYLSYLPSIQPVVQTINITSSQTIDFITQLSSPQIIYPLNIPTGFYSLYLHFVNIGIWSIAFELYPSDNSGAIGNAFGQSNVVSVDAMKTSPLSLYCVANSLTLDGLAYSQIVMRIRITLISESGTFTLNTQGINEYSLLQTTFTPQGAQGAQGNQGAQGAQGNQGAQGVTGHFNTDDLNIFSVVGISLPDYGNTWSQSLAFNGDFRKTCISASGQYMVAGVYGGYMYASSDYGVTWTTYSAGIKGWVDIAISASGKYQTALSYGQRIHTSSDYGITWTEIINVSSNYWTEVSMSASGQYQTAVANAMNNTGYIYVSVDFGATWTHKTNTNLNWHSVSVSASGQYQSAVIYGGNIYVSSDFGNTWVSKTSGTLNWESVSVSATGQYQSAVITGGSIYVSSDFGNTWMSKTTSNLSWYSISVSATGQYQSATTGNGNIYVSSDFGNNWIAKPASPFNLKSVSVSASGQYQLAAYSYGGIYVSKCAIGVQGAQGSQGDVGIQGSQGSQGDIGIQGSQGSQGDSNWINGTNGKIYYNNGNVGIGISVPSQSLDVSGNIIASGNITAIGTITSGSDYRIKDDIEPLNLRRHSVDNLNPVYFKFKRSRQESIGLIAHELQEHYPFLVEGNRDGEHTQTVNYNGLIGVLIKEVQELKRRVSVLEMNQP